MRPTPAPQQVFLPSTTERLPQQPVYFYGFLPGNLKVRQISNSDGVMSPAGNELTLLQLENSNAQAWSLSPSPGGVLIVHNESGRWLTASNDRLSLGPLNQATAFMLEGPMRDGRVYRLSTNGKYIAPYFDRNVNLSPSASTNTEWVIALGRCQSQNLESC